MAMTFGHPVRPIARTMDSRNQLLDQISAQTGDVFEVCGFLDIHGTGECTMDIQFPVAFIERPVFTFGGELAPNQILIQGSVPMVSGIVQNWLPNPPAIRADIGVQVYQGATLAIAFMAPTDLEWIFHFQFRGRALRNPSGTIATTTSGPI